jgi:hypothetical protein
MSDCGRRIYFALQNIHTPHPEKKLATLKSDKKEFYKKILEIGKKNIISIDETSFYLNMSKSLGRCEKGKKCYRTVHFKKKIFFLKSRTIKNL